MDIHMLEFAAHTLFRMCKEHPEICPHDYHWSYSSKSTEEGKLEKHYVCSLCGHEDIRIEDEENRYF